MKASPSPEPTPPSPEAPPPPPPEPAGAESQAPASEPTPAPAEPAGPASWPEWFGVLDLALVLVVLAVGFLSASFAARNSDVWLHLAAGRAMIDGPYSPGSDPFSFSGADRAWVHSSWLLDLAFYALYSVESSGALAVGLKAVAFTAAFGLLFFLRRPGHSLWPWAVFAACAIVSSAPQAHLRPTIASMLFLAITLVLIYRMPWKPNGWREPAILAGVIWLWACLDVWSLLGPLLVILITAGEYLNRFLMPADAEETDGPFYPPPPKPALVRAAILSVVAIFLNPMFLAAAIKGPGDAFGQLLPMELGIGIPETLKDDPELIGLWISPMSPQFRSHQSLGNNLNGYLFAAVLFGSLLALGAGFSRLRATHILLWFVFAGLALHHARLIPFFVIVAVPLAAAHINGLSSRLQLGPIDAPGTRILLTGSGLGRLLCLAAALTAAGAAYPGWLHPEAGDPAFAKRVDWAIRPDSGMVRGAKLLGNWRADGTLPEGVRGLAVSPEFADYCAWFAPGEKVFVNTRFSFHLPELADLMKVRGTLVGRRSGQVEDVLEDEETVDVCDRYQCGYIVLAASNRQRGDSRRLVVSMLALLAHEADWEAWHVDGRTVVIGRPRVVPTDWRRPVYDPVRLAFGPDIEKVPDGTTVQLPLPTESLLDEYALEHREVPPEADDAFVLFNYAEFSAQRAGIRWLSQLRSSLFVREAVGGGPMAVMADLMTRLPKERQQVGDDQLALPVLIVRAARRAVAEAPDRPEVYLGLALGYRHRFAPASDLSVFSQPYTTSVHNLQHLTALVRFLARAPAPEACTPHLAFQVMTEALNLAALYEQSGQLDLSCDAIRKALLYARVVPRDQLMLASRAGPKDEPLERLQQQIDDRTRRIEQVVSRLERLPTARERFMTARNSRLPGHAVEIYNSANESDFGRDIVPFTLAVIDLELAAGRLEAAVLRIANLDEQLQKPEAAEVRQQFGPTIRNQKSIQHRLEGNFTALNSALNQGSVPAQPPQLLKALENLEEVFLVASAVAGPTVALSGESLTRIDPQARLTLMPLDVFRIVTNNLRGEGLYQYDRALIAITQGDLVEAKRRLEMAARPQGISLDILGDAERLGRIERYLQLIEEATAGGKK